MSVQPEMPYDDLSTDELLEVLGEHYYTLITTGEEAVRNLAWDITTGTFAKFHGLSDERMGSVLVAFAKLMSDRWHTPAMNYYELRRFSLMTDFINSITGRK